MKEIQIKDYKGTICIDSNSKMDKLRVTIREGGRTKFYSHGTEIHPCEYDYPVSC